MNKTGSPLFEIDLRAETNLGGLPGAGFATDVTSFTTPAPGDPARSQVIRQRTAIRGIALADSLLTLIRSRKYGEYKFPGGGMEPGETSDQTLIREFREETGLAVLTGSIRPFGWCRELRPDPETSGILDMVSWYFLCETTGLPGSQDLDEYETRYGYHLVREFPETAAAHNESLMKDDWIQTRPWILRDSKVMRMLGTAGRSSCPRVSPGKGLHPPS